MAEAQPTIALTVPGELLGTLAAASKTAKEAARNVAQLERAQIAGIKKGKEFDTVLDGNLKKARLLEAQANRAIQMHRTAENASRSAAHAAFTQQQFARQRAHTQKEAFKAVQGLGGSAMGGNISALFSRGGVKDWADLADFAGAANLGNRLNAFAPHAAVLTAGVTSVINTYQSEKERQKELRDMLMSGKYKSFEGDIFEALHKKQSPMRALLNPFIGADDGAAKRIQDFAKLAARNPGKFSKGQLEEAFKSAPLRTPESIMSGPYDIHGLKRFFMPPDLAKKYAENQLRPLQKQWASEMWLIFQAVRTIHARDKIGPWTKEDDKFVLEEAIESFKLRHRKEIRENPGWEVAFDKALAEIEAKVAAATPALKPQEYGKPKRLPMERRFSRYADPLTMRPGAAPTAPRRNAITPGPAAPSVPSAPMPAAPAQSDFGWLTRPEEVDTSTSTFPRYAPREYSGQLRLEEEQLNPLTAPTAPAALAPADRFRLNSGRRMVRNKDDE